MENTKSISINFYRNLGKLFYAIAAADRNVREVEYNTLKEIIKAEWLLVDDIKDSFGTATAYQIDIVFDWLNNDGEYNAKACFDDFIVFKKNNEHLFNDKIKQLIMKTAGAIASSFSGKNKSELIMLANLNIQLQKTP
ncbi:MAG: hypothetical protein KAJ28_07275 [Flavobacteriaceae bacterium]|nr:hypothetical protein [Flavobacteriaceae bacterium]